MSDNKYLREAERLARVMANAYPKSRHRLYVRKDQIGEHDRQVAEIDEAFRKGIDSEVADFTKVPVFSADPKKVEAAVMKVLGLRRNLEDICDEVQAIRNRIDEVVDGLLLDSDGNHEDK